MYQGLYLTCNIRPQPIAPHLLSLMGDISLPVTLSQLITASVTGFCEPLTPSCCEPLGGYYLDLTLY